MKRPSITSLSPKHNFSTYLVLLFPEGGSIYIVFYLSRGTVAYKRAQTLSTNNTLCKAF